MISFYHPNLNGGKPLYLRLSPSKIEWTYNMNTKTINTYAGQVVQLLGINYDKLIIEGRFGLEGPHGKNGDGTTPSNIWDYSKSSGKPTDYSVGLTQLTSYFKDYFDIASQGANSGPNTRLSGDFNQIPMTISYTGYIDPNEGNIDTFSSNQIGIWSVYPMNFPSYNRSLDQFAPQWKIECEIEEADRNADVISTLKELERIKDGVGYDASRAYSDPLAAVSTIDQNGKTVVQNLSFQIDSPVDTVNTNFAEFLPTLDLQSLNNNFLLQEISTPIAGLTDQQRNAFININPGR